MRSPEIPVGAREHRARFCPRAGQQRIATSLIGQQTQLVARRPAITSGISDIRLPTPVHCCRTFIDRVVDSFPRVCRFRKEIGCSDSIRVGHGSDVKALQAIGREA